MRKLVLQPGLGIRAAFTLVLLTCLLPAPARPPLYGLALEGKDQATVRVFDQATKRTVWTHTFPRMGDYYWSRDHRALAFDVSNNYDPGFHIVVWRAGERIRSFYHKSFTDNDFVEKMLWSSDNRALLVVYGGSGMWDGDTGFLSCIDVDRRCVFDLNDIELGLNRVQWVSRHTFRYWEFNTITNPKTNIVTNVPASHPTYWHLPRWRSP